MLNELIYIVDKVVDDMLDRNTAIVSSGGITAHNRGKYRRYFKIFTMRNILGLTDSDVMNSCHIDKGGIIIARTAILNNRKLPFHNKYIEYLRHELKLDTGYAVPRETYRMIRALPYPFALRSRILRHIFLYGLLNATCYTCYKRDGKSIEAYIEVLRMLDKMKNQNKQI